jgi:AraC-like DNA-binding protein
MRDALIVEGWMTQLLCLLLIAALLSAHAHFKANRFLAATLFCGVYRQFLVVMQLRGTIVSFPFLLRTSFPFQLLAISLLYLYVTAITTPGFHLERKHAVHLLPFVFGFAWYLYDQGPYLQIVIKVLVAIPYMVRTQQQVSHFAKQSKDHISNLSHLQLKWLRTLLIAAYSVLAVDALDAVTGPDVPVWYLVPSAGLLSLMMLAYFSLRVSPVFAREVESQQADSNDDSPATEQKIDTSRLPDEQLQRLKDRLTDLMKNQAIYLNPELRLSDLAVALGIRPYRVSEILSRGLQTSFYDLVNRYRVAKAQDLLMAPDSAYLNLLGVAMESGFKSKSVFNDVFKKMTGKTPSQFRAEKMTVPAHSAH